MSYHKQGSHKRMTAMDTDSVRKRMVKVMGKHTPKKGKKRK